MLKISAYLDIWDSTFKQLRPSQMTIFISIQNDKMNIQYHKYNLWHCQIDSV